MVCVINGWVKQKGVAFFTTNRNRLPQAGPWIAISVYIESVLSIWWWHCKGGCWFYTLKIMPWKLFFVFLFFLMWVSFELIALRQSANQKVISSQQTFFLIHVMHLCVRLSVNLQLWGVNIRTFYLFIYFLNWHLISNVVFSNEAH